MDDGLKVRFLDGSLYTCMFDMSSTDWSAYAIKPIAQACFFFKLNCAFFIDVNADFIRACTGRFTSGENSVNSHVLGHVLAGIGSLTECNAW